MDMGEAVIDPSEIVCALFGVIGGVELLKSLFARRCTTCGLRGCASALGTCSRTPARPLETKLNSSLFGLRPWVTILP